MEPADTLPLLRDIFGPQVSLTRAALLKDKLDYQVWALVLAQPGLHIILKLGGPRSRYTCKFERLAAIHALAAQVGVPVAEVLAADESYRRWPWRYLVKVFVPGEEWAVVAQREPPADLNPAQAELGRAVAGLHRLRFARFGAIGNDGQVAQPLSSLEGMRWHAGQILRDPAGLDFFLRALQGQESVFDRPLPPALAHEDLHRHNLLLRPGPAGWQLAAILDFEKAWAGQAEADLARMELWKMTGPAFWQAYWQAGGPAYHQQTGLAEGYEARRPWYQLLWCLEFAKNTPAHLRDTQALCRALQLPYITGFEPLRVEHNI